MKGLTWLHEIAELVYSERVGVRFLDAICPSETETLAPYLRPEVLGLFDKLDPRELVIHNQRPEQNSTRPFS